MREPLAQGEVMRLIETRADAHLRIWIRDRQRSHHLVLRYTGHARQLGQLARARNRIPGECGWDDLQVPDRGVLDEGSAVAVINDPSLGFEHDSMDSVGAGQAGQKRSV